MIDLDSNDLDKGKEEFANIARSMTGSIISTNELFKAVRTMSGVIKKEIHLKTDSMLQKTNLPFDKAYPLAKKGFIDLANELNIDPAVLFQVYIENKVMY